MIKTSNTFSDIFSVLVFPELMKILFEKIVIIVISYNIICDNHSQEKKTLANIVFGRTNSAAYIHRTDDLL
ncbi:hypothetical protein DW959_13600 [Clostridium sp. AM46-21]|nr:hypothetical protein DWY07_01715 [Clostridium sp. AF23-6LB]RHS50815.1 hypothetical protein DW959_13600 [Clostridium sp. AM46-21]